jgi:DnaJ-class molecular chaperone
MANTLLSEYEAAALVGMSPTLLRFFASRKAKKNENRKLAVAKKVDDTLYFDEEELRAYDKWLRQPWPAENGKRPYLPSPIRDEIRQEANLECALCYRSGEAGEAAHIRDVATSKNNHPHNLIWLCSNHHTKLDNGSFGPKGVENSDILSLKHGLQLFSKHAWLGQAQISKQIAATLSLCDDMQKQLRISQSPVAVKAIEALGTRALTLLPKLASYSEAKEVRATLKKLTSKIASGKAASGLTTAQRLVDAVSFEEEFLEKSGLKRCPLCEGAKAHNGYDCPVCHADGTIDADIQVDLEEFELITCQLCGGCGRHEGEDCPVCRGERKLERRFADLIDFREYDPVDCPLCEGSGNWEGDECRECRGEKRIPKGLADQVDLSDYQYVDCPRCDGGGSFRGEDCPECGGERTMLSKYATEVDLSKYDEHECRLCHGTSYYCDEVCPACGGDGHMTREQSEATDFASFAMVDCRKCKGRGHLHGEDCRSCGGERKIQRRFAERSDDY